MSEATNYLENALANHLCKVATYTPPAALYLALYTVAPTDSTAGTEVTGSGYVRQPVTWSAASSGICTNSGAIEFPNTAWSGSIVAVGMLDQLSGGNLLTYTPISPALAVSSGQKVIAAIGGVSVSVD